MRIRSIKPEFWRSEDIAALEWDARLLFIGLWSYVDDNGVGVDRLADITADLFALDLERDSSETFARVSRGLQTLSEAGRITRYIAAGKRFLHITNWDKHQRIDKPNKERYPLPTCKDVEIRETVATPSREGSETPAPGTGEQGNRGTGESSKSTPLASLVDLDKDPDFAAFWSAYPRRTDKGHAKRAWKGMLRKQIDPSTVIVAAKSFAVTCQGTDAQFIPHPSTWLNGERWTDEQAKPPYDPDAWMQR